MKKKQKALLAYVWVALLFKEQIPKEICVFNDRAKRSSGDEAKGKVKAAAHDKQQGRFPLHGNLATLQHHTLKDECTSVSSRSNTKQGRWARRSSTGGNRDWKSAKQARSRMPHDTHTERSSAP